MSHRRILGLKWAAPDDKGPGFGPNRSKGAKALGRRFEASLQRSLSKDFIRGQWFRFEDSNGLGWCQPDFLLRGAHAVLVLEAKYTWCPEGHSQVEMLYKPVLELVWKLPVYGVQICKVLVPEARQWATICPDLGSALAAARLGRRVCIAWQPNTPLKIGAAPPFPVNATGALLAAD